MQESGSSVFVEKRYIACGATGALQKYQRMLNVPQNPWDLTINRILNGNMNTSFFRKLQKKIACI